MTTPPIPPRPMIDFDSVGFWDAAKEGRLTVCHCRACGTWMPRPLEVCSVCAQPTTFDEVSGAGTIHSFIMVRQPTVPAFAALVPYVLALVELEEGPRITGMLLDESGDGVAIDQAVRAELTTFPGAAEPAITFRLARESLIYPSGGLEALGAAAVDVQDRALHERGGRRQQE